MDEFFILNNKTGELIDCARKDDMLELLIDYAKDTDIIKVINSEIGYYVLMTHDGKLLYTGMNKKLYMPTGA